MTAIDNGTYVYRTETAGGAVVDVFYEHHVDRFFANTDRWLYRVVCEMCNDVHTTREEQDDLMAAAAKARAHAKDCTAPPTYRLGSAPVAPALKPLKSNCTCACHGSETAA